MAKSKRDNVILKCSVCGEQNYITTRNKRNHPDKMEKMKYCPRCKKETLHKEAK
jgi:large subunit ribosomal protein L33